MQPMVRIKSLFFFQSAYIAGKGHNPKHNRYMLHSEQQFQLLSANKAKLWGEVLDRE